MTLPKALRKALPNCLPMEILLRDIQVDQNLDQEP